jgi:hypothetical protein
VLEEFDIINCSQFVFCLMSYVSGLFVELSASRRKSCRYSRKCNQFTLLYKLLLGSFLMVFWFPVSDWEELRVHSLVASVWYKGSRLIFGWYEAEIYTWC